eukprot:3396984-Rhodomonas_salina.1
MPLLDELGMRKEMRQKAFAKGRSPVILQPGSVHRAILDPIDAIRIEASTKNPCQYRDTKNKE